MDNKMPLPEQNDMDLWDIYVKAYNEQRKRMQDIRKNASDFVALVRYGLSLSNPSPAFEFLENLSSEDLKPYLNFLLDRATHNNGWANLSAEHLLRMPRQWLIDNIESEADILLSDIGDEEQYGKLLLLFMELDSGLAERLAQKAIFHPDRDIQQIGREYFDQRMTRPNS
jgi:hypothetical protein